MFTKPNGYSNDEEPVELYPVNDDTFFGTSKHIGGFKLKFVKDAEGEVLNFRLHFAPQLALLHLPFDKVR